MVAIVDSVALNGISAIIVNAEVTVSSGLPQLTLIGLADRACAESRERYTFPFPHKDPQPLQIPKTTSPRKTASIAASHTSISRTIPS